MQARSSEANSGGLEALLAPLSLDQFLAEYFGRSPVHLAGSSGRFDRLLDWDGLARLLDVHPADPERLRIVLRGKEIGRERYVRTLGRVPRLDGGALSLLLDSGATLIISHVDDIVPQVAAVADEIGDRLGARTAVNLYATWRLDHGFDPHWDHHDVLVLQLAGRKKWSIFNPTRVDPLRGDRFVGPPEGTLPDREESLESGDVLYLPRGWIHAAVPAGDPSLHLTVAITRPTSAGFLEWLVEELKSRPEVRAAIPFASDRKSWDQWKRRIATIVTEMVSGQAPDRFVAHKDSERGARPQFSFPDFGRIPPAEWNELTVLRPASLHRFVVGTAQDGASQVEVLGQAWPCSPAVAAAIGRLSSTSPSTLGALQKDLTKEEAAELGQLLALAATMGLLSATKG